MNRLTKDPLEIKTMFSSIASHYDFLNRLLSLGRDVYWRRFAVNQLPHIENAVFLDVATGTGDVAIEIVKRHSSVKRVVGIDFSGQMLKLARKKVLKLGYDGKITFDLGDTMSLPFDDNTFDAVIIAFGIRNVKDYKVGISEMMRVVRNGGRVIILEFTNTQSRVFRWLYHVYFTKVLPFVGETISGKRGAYRYLRDSVLDFPNPEKLKTVMSEIGLKDVRYYNLTFGVVAVHAGTK